MKKIPTIFVRDWEGALGPPARFVTHLPHPECHWVFAGEGVATRKLDGSCCLVRDGALYKRHEVKVGKSTPDGFEAIETDPETGNVVGWVPVGDGPEDRWHREALDGELHRRDGSELPDGTYELVGPKIQGNPEVCPVHALVPHTVAALNLGADGGHGPDDVPLDYDGLRDWLAANNVEGVVWHHPDGRMAKIKGKDFGIRRA